MTTIIKLKKESSTQLDNNDIPNSVSSKQLIKIWLVPQPSHINYDQKIKFHCCYILRSKSNPRRTYIGYSVNPFHRLRQHNQEITGGAKKTKYHGPWELICYISGFHNQREGLQFEWRLQHPIRGLRNSKTKKAYPGIFELGYDVKLQKGNGLNGILRRIAQSCCLRKWTKNSVSAKCRPLTLYWKTPGLALPFDAPHIRCIDLS